MLEINAEEVPFEKGPNSPDYVNFSKVAEATDGFSGADVAAIANTAVSFVIHEHLTNLLWVDKPKQKLLKPKLPKRMYHLRIQI